LTWSSSKVWYSKSAASPTISASDCATAREPTPILLRRPLRDSQRTLGQQLRGIAALGSRGDSIRDDPLELRHEAALLGGRSRRLFPQQVAVPLWQAGPLGSARINKASPSQSAAISLSLRKWPEVSPLVHSRPLLRLQKVTRPVACVAARASRFMYPSMSTAPLPASWTTAGSKPPPLSSRALQAVMDSMSYLDSRGAQLPLQVRNGDFAGVKDAGRKRCVHLGRLKHIGKVLRLARAAGGDQGNVAHLAHGPQLVDVVASRTPSLDMQLSTISPAPRCCASITQSMVLRAVSRVRAASPVNCCTR